MSSQNNFVFLSKRILATVDFLKWTSTFGDDGIAQIEEPMRGVRLSPALSDLFGFARDDTGVMLTMDAREAPWLADLPVAAVLTGYGTNILLITEAFDAIGTAFPAIGIEIYVPLERQADLAGETLFGFCLIKDGVPERVGRIVPVYTPETVSAVARTQTDQSSSLFAGS